MLEISVLRVENPSCLWGRIVKGPGMEAESHKEYSLLQVRMNLFYSVTREKLPSINKGQVCVIYWYTLKSWCRAVVESVFMHTDGRKAKCFLVDHGEHVIVHFDDIQAPMENLLQLPFWARKFQLSRVHPMTLQVSICEEKAELIPANQWDSSATLYFHKLLRASTLTEAVLNETQADSTAIELYVTIQNVKICVNDDLVAKKFACYSSVLNHAGTQKEDMGQSLAMLACDLFTDNMFSVTNGCTIRSLLPRIEPSAAPQVTEEKSQMNSGQENATPEKIPENGKKDFMGSNSQDESKTVLSRHKSGKGKAATSNRKRHGSGDTDSSLGEALLRNLNLFRCLTFLNPGTSAHTAMPNIDAIGEADKYTLQDRELPNEEKKLDDVEDSDVTVSSLEENNEEPEVRLPWHAVESTEISTHVDIVGDPPEAEVKLRKANREEELACARLLQWLNPRRSNSEDTTDSTDDSTDGTATATDPQTTEVLVHSDFPLEPCSSLANSPISDASRRILMRQNYTGPLLPESYCWPAVARGSDTVLISHNADSPLTYVPPLLAHMQCSSVYSAVTSCTGPLAVILCPSWVKTQAVFDLLEKHKANHTLHAVTALVGVGRDEAKTVKIPNDCLLVVTTPFSLVRLLAFHCFLFLRLCHLVLDEAGSLFSQAPDEMTAILNHFQTVTSGEERASCPRQIVALDRGWSGSMEGLLSQHMTSPTVIITTLEEAALYGNVHQMIHMCLEDSKISWLFRVVDFTPDVAHKTLIVANSAEDVDHVYKAIGNTSAFCVKIHEGLTHQYDFVLEQWTKNFGAGTHITLVTTNCCLKALGIRDATCVIHYGFPNSAKLFGRRLFCMADNFRNLSSKEHAKDSGSHPPKSVLLISERNTRHMTGVLRYLRRTAALPPPELLHFAHGVLEAREEQKRNRPLCGDLKSFGVCRDSSACPYRHKFCPDLDRSLLPHSGTVTVLPLYIKTASVYGGRIVAKQNDVYESLATEMTSFYANEKLSAMDVVVGGLYGVKEDQIFHRVRVTSMPDKGERLFSIVTALFIDEGHEQEVKTHQLLQLPAQFHSLPAQAVEIIVCKVKPVDAEADWNPKVTRVVSQKIKGLQHQAKIVHSLGDTIFVDSMVRMTRMPNLKTCVYEYNVVSMILNTGLGTSNEQHLQLLEKLCQGAVVTELETNNINGMDSSVAVVEDKMQAAEEALAEAFRAAVARHLCGQEVSADPAQAQTGDSESRYILPPLVMPPADPPESQDTAPVVTELPKFPTPVPAKPSDNKSKVEELNANTPPSHDWVSIVFRPYENGLPVVEKQINGRHIGVDTAVSIDKPNSVDSSQSFHPHITWYQKGDSLTVNVKLTSPVAQKCEFFCDRVVYSGSVQGRSYRADLALHDTIAADKCSWEMKCNEPVLNLVKEQKGPWNTLLKHKNRLVSCDFDHFEEDEEKPTNDVRFLGHTGEDYCYVNSESGSESD